VTDTQIEFPDQAAGSRTLARFAEFDRLRFHPDRDFAGLHLLVRKWARAASAASI
jgi:hypothetical protein